MNVIVLLFRKLKKVLSFNKHPHKCPYCGEKEKLARKWGYFPDNCLNIRKKNGFYPYTLCAEDEWHTAIICLNCYRIFDWLHGDFAGKYENLPTLQELTGWKVSFPTVLRDKNGVPVFGTIRSKQMYAEYNK